MFKQELPLLLYSLLESILLLLDQQIFIFTLLPRLAPILPRLSILLLSKGLILLLSLVVTQLSFILSLQLEPTLLSLFKELRLEYLQPSISQLYFIIDFIK